MAMMIWVFLGCLIFYAFFLLCYIQFINLYPNLSPEKFSGHRSDEDIDLMLSALFLEQ